MPGSFFDTNVLVYVASGDRVKADRAEEIIGNGGTISVQVLNELANVARRKMGMSWQETHSFLSALRSLLAICPVTVDMHETGLALAERYNLSIYDAMIAAAALHVDCDTLWSEDMQHGLVLDGRLRILNPFHAVSPQVLLEEVRASSGTKAVAGPSAARSQDFLYDDDGLPK